MADRLNILVIIGSVREGRMALPIAHWVMAGGADHDALALELVDLRDWDLPFFPHPKPPATGDYPGESQRRWAAKVASADGYILIAPEYNHGMSAVLKNALDTVFAEWSRKPVAFVAYGGAGGARSVEQLRLTACALEMAPLGSAVHLVRPGSKREGDRFNGDTHDDKALASVFEELAWWGKTLKAGRES
jgi:NAD(P)H-dependent FMN reductase